MAFGQGAGGEDVDDRQRVHGPGGGTPDDPAVDVDPEGELTNEDPDHRLGGILALGGEADLELDHLPLALDGDVDGVARDLPLHRLSQVRGGVDRAPAQGDDLVADLQHFSRRCVGGVAGDVHRGVVGAGVDLAQGDADGGGGGLVHELEVAAPVVLVALLGTAHQLASDDVHRRVGGRHHRLEDVDVLAGDGQHHQLAVRGVGLRPVHHDGVDRVGHRTRGVGDEGEGDVPSHDDQPHQEEEHGGGDQRPMALLFRGTRHTGIVSAAPLYPAALESPPCPMPQP